MSYKIKPATLSWNQAPEPYSELFDDVYFSSGDELEELQYVFIKQNQLLSRWKHCTSKHYVIGKTSFGSGLNFLILCQTFEQFIKENPGHCLKRLYFISFERYPLTAPDLINAHQRWPQLSAYATQLQQAYPPAVPGCHRLDVSLTTSIKHHIILDLWFGNIKETLPQVHSGPDGIIDSWMLDAFAPIKNSDMWCQQLYHDIATITKNNASLATFTTADHVQRGLQQAGFSITKVKDFGIKREMLTASFKRTNKQSSTPSWYYRPHAEKIKEVTIIGGGIASAALTFALAKRGIKVNLLCQDPQLAMAASGNVQGGFYPLINSQHDYLSQFYSQAFSYARQVIQPLMTTKKLVNAKFCGALLLSYNDKLASRHQQIVSSGWFPDNFVQPLDAQQASTTAGIKLSHSALYFPSAGWLSPNQLTKVLIEQAQLLTTVNIYYDHQVHDIEYQAPAQRWQVNLVNRQPLTCRYLILANGHQLDKFQQTKDLSLYQTSGQVSHIESNNALKPLRTLLCYKGYLTPALQQQHCLGASFERGKNHLKLSQAEHISNIEKLQQCVEHATWSMAIDRDALAGKVGIRMSAKDHLPMVGSVPDVKLTQSLYHDLARGKPAKQYYNAPVHHNLFMIGALGSRGLCSALLLGEVLSAQLCNEPQPVAQTLLNQLNPNRYWIKQLKSGNSIVS